jgi:hypothetical protein
MSNLYRFRFENLSKPLFDIIVEKVLASRNPDFGNVEFDDVEVKPFVRNLTFTIIDFSNTFQTYKNYNSFAYRIYAHVVFMSWVL